MGKRTRRQLETIRARLDALDARLRQYERPVYAINDAGWHVVAMSLDPIWRDHFIDARAPEDDPESQKVNDLKAIIDARAQADARRPYLEQIIASERQEIQHERAQRNAPEYG